MSKLQLFIIIIVSCWFSYVFGQDEEDLKGDVKSLRTIHYEATEDSSKFVKSDVINESIAFHNYSGEVEKFLILHEHDTTVHTYRHGTDGKLIETTHFRRDKVHYRISFTYNADGKRISEERFDLLLDSVVSTRVYQYDSEGRYEATQGNDESLKNKPLMKYDEAGNLIEGIFDQGRIELHYDSLGREVEEVMYGPEGTLLCKGITVYEDGFMKEYIQQDGEGSIEWRLSYEYSNFDRVGNWLRKETFEDGELIEFTIREIEYYK